MLQRLDVKLVLAAISGVLVGLILEDPPSYMYGEPAFIDWLLDLLYVLALPGAIFASSILWPYLRHDDHFLPRAFALFAASVLSYWCAVNVMDIIASIDPRLDLGLTAIISASIVGGGIVFVAAKFIAPFKWTMRYLLFGLSVGIVGGSAFYALMNTPVLGVAASFVVWHCIVCAGLHFATRRVGEPAHA